MDRRTTPTVTNPMAKVSKSLMLNPELVQVIDAVSATTGASFTKITTAALIQYLLRDFPSPDTKWMKLAVALERADLSLPHVLLRVLDERVDWYRKDVDLAESPNAARLMQLEATENHDRAERTRDDWTKAIFESDRPLELLIGTLTERQRTERHASDT